MRPFVSSASLLFLLRERVVSQSVLRKVRDFKYFSSTSLFCSESAAPHRYAVLCCFHSNQSVKNVEDVSVWHSWHRTAYAICLSYRYSPKWRWRRREELLNKVIILICVEKAFLSLHDSPIEPLMADGLFWWCLSYFSGPWQWYLLGSQWHSHKPPGFHPKYLKLCSEEEQSFYRFGTIWG